jgi:putative FmdB family regulatory protein
MACQHREMPLDFSSKIPGAKGYRVPLYDYKCTACEHRYEMRQGFDAPPRQKCPVCGEEAKRVLHAPPIVFKGSGFYVTDSRKGSQVTVGDGGTGAAPPTPAPETKSDNGNNGSSESKPAAASTTD